MNRRSLLGVTPFRAAYTVKARASKITAERDRILRTAGFDDIEDEWGNIEPSMRESHGAGVGRGRTFGEMDALAEYFRLAGQFLHDHQFSNPVERRIWELHQDGASYTRINRTVAREVAAGELPLLLLRKPRGNVGTYRKMVSCVVVRLRSIMLGVSRDNPRRGRPPDPNGCHRGGRVLAVRLPAAAQAAVARLVARTGQCQSAVIRWLITEVDKRMQQTGDGILGGYPAQDG